MQSLTLTIGLTAGILILFLRPSYGLGVYLAVLFLYPSYLTVRVFGCNLSAQRILIAVLLIRVLIDQNLLSKFKINLLDKLMIAMFVIGFITMSITMNITDFAKTYSGQFMDSAVVYFLFRLIITSRHSLLSIMKILSPILFVAAVIGVIQSITGKSPYDGMYSYCQWNLEGEPVNQGERVGLFRAYGSDAVHIMFGLSFVAFLPLILLLRQEGGKWKVMTYIFFTAAIAGTLSSISAGPYLGILTVLFCLFIRRRPQYIKPLLIGLALIVFSVEILSNRGFFYVASRFAFHEGNAWYRARLMDVAIMKLPEYWMFGYGMVEPGWGPLIDNREHTDVCNQYVLQAIYHGISGAAIFVSMLWTAVAGLRRLAIYSPDRRLKDTAWLIGIAIVSLAVVFFSVGVFGKFTAVFYSLLGIAGCFYIPKIVKKPARFPSIVLKLT